MDRPEDLQMYDTSDTAGRIIQAAEKLFSEQGFKETTMRQITGLLKSILQRSIITLAPSSELIRSVAERSLSPLCEQVDKGLVQLNVADATPGLDQLLQLMAQALVHVHGQNQNALSVLMRLLDQAYLPVNMIFRLSCVSATGRVLIVICSISGRTQRRWTSVNSSGVSISAWFGDFTLSNMHNTECA